MSKTYSLFDRQFHQPDPSTSSAPDVFIMVLSDAGEFSARFHQHGKPTSIPIPFKERHDDAAIGQKVLAHLHAS